MSAQVGICMPVTSRQIHRKMAPLCAQGALRTGSAQPALIRDACRKLR
jgi:hypothetical protein